MVESVSKIRKGLESNWLEEQATSAPYSVGGLGKLLSPSEPHLLISKARLETVPISFILGDHTGCLWKCCYKTHWPTQIGTGI